jgi:hypothetical protein
MTERYPLRERLLHAAISTVIGAVFHDRLNRWRTVMTWRSFILWRLLPSVIIVFAKRWAKSRPSNVRQPDQ